MWSHVFLEHIVDTVVTKPEVIISRFWQRYKKFQRLFMFSKTACSQRQLLMTAMSPLPEVQIWQCDTGSSYISCFGTVREEIWTTWCFQERPVYWPQNMFLDIPLYRKCVGLHGGFKTGNGFAWHITNKYRFSVEDGMLSGVNVYLSLSGCGTCRSVIPVTQPFSTEKHDRHITVECWRFFLRALGNNFRLLTVVATLG